MGVSPVMFNGRDLYIPGYYAKRNISALDIGAATGSRLLLLGECKGGVPFDAVVDFPNAEDRINWVTNSEEVNNILRDGAALYGALFALTPSNDPAINGASAVGVIRMNKATKSSSILKDPDTNNVMDLKSVGYGVYTSQIRRKISSGTVKGKNITLKFEEVSLNEDNIIKELFSMQYIGAGTACSLTIDPAGNLVTTVTGGPGGEDLSLSIATYATVYDLVQAININPAYSAVLLGDGSFASNKLDKVIIGDAVDISTVYTVSAIFQAILDFFNRSGLTTANIYSGAARRIPANDLDYVFLSGGTDGGSPVQQDWQDALDEICAKVDASLVGVMTSNAAVHAALSAHLTYMSGVDGRNERQGAVGSEDGDGDSAKIAAANSINNSLAAYCGTEIKRYDKNGELKTWSGVYRAAQFLGMASGNPITMAHTNKQINVIGLKQAYSPTQKNNFIKGGVVCDSPSPLGGVRCVRSITTYQGSNLIANEFSVMRTILFITKDHRTFVEGLIGDAGDPTTLESIKNRALTRLDYYVEQGWLVTDPDLGNAYRSFTFTVVGDKVYISYEGTVVVPVNFVLVNHNFTVIGIRK